MKRFVTIALVSLLSSIAFTAAAQAQFVNDANANGRAAFSYYNVNDGDVYNVSATVTTADGTIPLNVYDSFTSDVNSPVTQITASDPGDGLVLRLFIIPPPSGGTVTLTATPVGGGTSITGSKFYLPSVTKISTTTSLTGTPLSQVYGAIVLTATVTASPAPNSGSVTFYADQAPLSPTATVSSGVAFLHAEGLPVGAHTITAKYSGDNTYQSSISTAITLTVTPANLTVTGITADNKVYDGSTTATLHTAGVGLQGVVVGDNVTPNAGSTAGTFSDENIGLGKTVTVAGITISGGSIGNYTLIQPTTTANITPKELTVTGVTASNKVYDGNMNAVLNTAGATLSGVVNSEDVKLNGGTGTFSDANVGDAKTITVAGLTLTGTAAGNYQLSASAVTTAANITKADQVITWSNPADIVYGTVLSSTQLNATVAGVSGGSAPGALTYTTPVGTLLNAGSGQNLSVTAAATTNYNSATASVTINVLKVTPVITWANPADITYGTLLSATQLNATADVPGTFTYTPPSGTKLNAGPGQNLKVDFTPTDAVNYSAATKTVTINVTGGAPVITWANPADITYGTLLSATQLNATADVPGTFTYTPPSGTKLNAGPGQNLKVDFTPTDAVNYSAATKTVTINVTGGTPVITWANPADITYGTLLSATQLNATADVPGTFTYTPPSGTKLNAGPGQNLKVDFAPTDAVNYSAATKTVTINVAKAPLTASFTANDKPYDGNTTATIATRKVNGVVGSDDVSLTGGVATFADKNVGTGKTVTATGFSVSGASVGNYVLSSPSASATASITPLPLTVTGITANDKVYDGTTTATLNTSGATLVGVISPDVVTLNTSGATGTFADKEIGTAKTVTITGLTISGTDAGNYTLTQPTTRASITAPPVNSGYVAGAGWVNSPAGAFVKGPSTTGRGYFAFAAAYIGKNPLTPTGLVAFQLKTKGLFYPAVLSFTSAQFEELVVSGSQATLKGTGTVDGSGSYGFLLSVIDGQGLLTGNKLRLKVWDENHNNAVVYDNQMGTGDNASPTGAVTGLIAVSKSGGSTAVANVSLQQLIEEDAATEMPTQYELYNAYPNPFNPSTTIMFDLPEASKVRLVVYDMLGREVAVLADGERPAGHYSLRFDAGKLSSGMYIYRLQTNNYTQTKKLMLMK
jgi:hypothetical protein